MLVLAGKRKMHSLCHYAQLLATNSSCFSVCSSSATQHVLVLVEKRKSIAFVILHSC